MMRDEDIDAVKSQVNMLMLAEAYGMRVNRAGFMLCPFHGDKHESLKVYPGYAARDGFKCWACGKSGSIFTFVMEYEGIGFEDAVRKIASMFNIPVSDAGKPPDERDVGAYRARMRMREVWKRVEQMNRERIMELSESIRWCEDAREQREPFGPAWCALTDAIERMQHEWEERFRMEA